MICEIRNVVFSLKGGRMSALMHDRPAVERRLCGWLGDAWNRESLVRMAVTVADAENQRDAQVASIIQQRRQESNMTLLQPPGR
jgi:hypothetical protein